MAGERKNKIVIYISDSNESDDVLSTAINISKSKISAWAIAVDATATGRGVRKTVENIEKYSHPVSDSVKSKLGLIPPQN